MKGFFKDILVSILGGQVRRLRERNKERNNFKIIGVVGSIGKTSTKLAIAKVLESGKKVRYQEGNYNEILSVPLVFFGEKMPNLFNVFAWIAIIVRNEIQIFSQYKFDVVVVELGTDKPGDINLFRKYLLLDMAVVTAVTFEHMEFFKNLEEVASEEFSVAYFSDVVFVNKDLCSIIPENIDHKKLVFYGKEFGAIYKIENVMKGKGGLEFDIYFEDKKLVSLTYPAVSEVQLYSITVATIIAQAFQIPQERVKRAVNKIESFAGRMQRLAGIKNSLIIDDTYNASPEAMKIALDTLYSYPSIQRIAILGMMNELGEISKDEHMKVGKYCDPKLLDLVVTIGKDANAYLGPAARENGCIVYEAANAMKAGEYVKNKLKEKAVILAKGSQNGVFAEEALKPLLADPSHSRRLVRQDDVWMKKKQN